MTLASQTDMLPEVIEEIKTCESIQNSHESAYAKERAKITAYNHIRQLLGFYPEEEQDD